LPPNFFSLSESQLEEYLAQAFLALVDLVISTIRHDPDYPAGKPSYNVIMTLQHIHLIPRRSDTYVIASTGQRVSVNSLGFVGHLLVKSEEELEGVKTEGIFNILRGVALKSVHDLQVDGTSREAPEP
jgi:sulfate adenylyltransferase (ADP) / ATP adenylyltransferase